ncbi:MULTISPECIES: hypothetical protein [Pseudomonas]|uniref:Uncharacterized protein n=1 Tax=Pseudomonas lutea TaxID=243924 RepID=A0A9X8QLS3_9PSED|nr:MULTISPECIES: hypothetical protein [Pseudomonas]SER37654.1 hypothetical protein SAMN05216409_118105 [Pseudomonas lutea]
MLSPESRIKQAAERAQAEVEALEKAKTVSPMLYFGSMILAAFAAAALLHIAQ